MISFLKQRNFIAIICLWVMLGNLPVIAQTREQNDTTLKVATFVETMAEFPDDLYKWLAKNINYPKVDQKNKISGRVVVQFIVDTLGNVRDVTIVKSVSPTIDVETIRVINSMPQWKPATQNNKPVNLRYTLPIKYSLEDSKSSKAAEYVGIALGGIIGITVSLLIGAWLKRVL